MCSAARLPMKMVIIKSWGRREQKTDIRSRRRSQATMAASGVVAGNLECERRDARTGGLSVAPVYERSGYVDTLRFPGYIGNAVLLTGDFSTNDECTPLTPSILVSFCSRKCW